MKNGKLQAKDIPDNLILEALYPYQGSWAFWCNNNELWLGRSETRSIDRTLCIYPRKLVHAKWKSLVRRGLVGGCDCGCRGDFEITDKGLEKLGKPRIKEYTGY